MASPRPSEAGLTNAPECSRARSDGAYAKLRPGAEEARARGLPPGHEGLRVDGAGSFVDNPALTPAHGRAGDGKDSSDHVSGHR
jgi:hypothetical protein